MCQECDCQKKERSTEEYRRLVNRLSRIEGQVRGIRGMLEKDAYCIDILAQVAAVNAALNAFSRELLAQHLCTCVADDLRQGSEDKVEELAAALQKLLK
ncbi:metal-sensing transcriptional repressor [Acutalibacter intestini]|uniref:metal-sensing transcriptional repressor n=1 Tax=Acutalibacter intestini TaxID=3093659 RepID=UPI002AC9877B|nr:metal-sensing transcriptional repressor [Acutalibacter sp. M00204]